MYFPDANRMQQIRKKEKAIIWTLPVGNTKNNTTDNKPAARQCGNRG